MIFSKGCKKFLYRRSPGKRTTFLQIFLIPVITKGLNFKWIVAVRNVMTLSIHPSNQIEEGVEEPMEDEQHLHLLPKVNFFMADQRRLIMRLARDPDENEK